MYCTALKRVEMCHIRFSALWLVLGIRSCKHLLSVSIHLSTFNTVYRDNTIACSGSKASHSVPLIRFSNHVPWYSSVSSGIVTTVKDIPLCWSVLPNCLIAFEIALKILVELELVG